MPIVSKTSPANLAKLQSLEDVLQLKPEYLRIPAAMRVTGLSKNQIFAAIATGKVKSKLIIRPGAKKGVRLISYQALIDYVESFGD